MQSENLLNINLAHAAEAAKRLDVELTDRFFADLEQEEISGGDVHAEIFVRASAGNIFNVQIKVKGNVIVACDRCLDPLSIEVEKSMMLRYWLIVAYFVNNYHHSLNFSMSRGEAIVI